MEVSKNVKYIAVTSGSSKLGFKSRRSGTLKTGNFEALKVTAMYFTFSETSNLFLYG